MKSNNRQRGIGLVEVLVGVSIISASLVGLIGAFNLYVRAGLSNTEKLQALFLAEEGLEAVRFLRDSSFGGNIVPLSTATDQYLYFEMGTWSLSPVATTTDIFTRTIVLDDVYRRTSDNDIVSVSSSDPKVLDPDARKVTVIVSWGRGTTTIITYITDLFDN